MASLVGGVSLGGVGWGRRGRLNREEGWARRRGG